MGAQVLQRDTREFNFMTCRKFFEALEKNQLYSRLSYQHNY